MKRDHYLPASFVGRFSLERTGALRNRRIWVRHARSDRLVASTPNAIGFRRGLYNISSPGELTSIDKWGYEAALPEVLEALSAGRQLSLDDYLRVAVPFVAGLFVRGADFARRFESIPIIKDLMDSGQITSDNTNYGRVIRLQRLLSPVTGARWVVLHASEQVDIVSNSLGLCATLDASSGDVGWAIPLDRSTMLGIFPRKLRQIATYTREGVWQARIEHLYPSDRVFSTLNQSMARCADEFLFGGSRETVEEVGSIGAQDLHDLLYTMEHRWAEMISREEQVAHEMEWYYLSAISNLNLDPEQALQYKWDPVDLDVSMKWTPPIMVLPLNLSRFPSGVGTRDAELWLNLHLLDDFDKHVMRSGDK